MSADKNRHVYGVRNMTTLALGAGRSAKDVFADALKRWPAKVVALRLKAPIRTVEGWRERRSAPAAEYVLLMLKDEILCADVMREIGRGDLASVQEARAQLRAAMSALNEGDL